MSGKRAGPCEADECHTVATKAITRQGEVCLIACEEHEEPLLSIARTIWSGRLEVVTISATLS